MLLWGVAQHATVHFACVVIGCQEQAAFDYYLAPWTKQKPSHCKMALQRHVLCTHSVPMGSSLAVVVHGALGQDWDVSMEEAMLIVNLGCFNGGFRVEHTP